MTRKWSLSGRDRSEREQRETPGTVWEWIARTRVIKGHSFMAFGDTLLCQNRTNYECFTCTR